MPRASLTVPAIPAGGGEGSATSDVPVAISAWALARICALSTSAVDAGSVHFTVSELASRRASQELEATTATALYVPATTLPRVSDAVQGTTAIAEEGFAGMFTGATSVPPSVGQCLIVANTMSGNHVSIPYFALPSTLDGMSTRGSGFPMSRKLAGSVSGGSPAGRVIPAAAVASSA